MRNEIVAGYRLVVPSVVTARTQESIGAGCKLSVIDRPLNSRLTPRFVCTLQSGLVTESLAGPKAETHEINLHLIAIRRQNQTWRFSIT